MLKYLFFCITWNVIRDHSYKIADGRGLGSKKVENLWACYMNGSYAKISCNKKSRVFSAHDYFMMNPSLSGRGKIKGAKKPKKLLALLDNV